MKKMVVGFIISAFLMLAVSAQSLDNTYVDNESGEQEIENVVTPSVSEEVKEEKEEIKKPSYSEFRISKDSNELEGLLGIKFNSPINAVKSLLADSGKIKIKKNVLTFVPRNKSFASLPIKEILFYFENDNFVEAKIILNEKHDADNKIALDTQINLFLVIDNLQKKYDLEKIEHNMVVSDGKTTFDFYNVSLRSKNQNNVFFQLYMSMNEINGSIIYSASNSSRLNNAKSDL